LDVDSEDYHLSIIQFGAALRGPWLGFQAGCAGDRLSGSVQRFLDVEPIEDLDSLRKQFRGGVPDPGRAIAHQHRASGRRGREASRNTRSARSDRLGLVSRVAALSIAAE
jgi:hypothetical protein